MAADVTDEHDGLFSDDAEVSVLGAMMLESSAADYVLDVLESRDFARPQHRVIFGAIHALRKDGVEPHPLVLREQLERQDLLEKAGGSEYLARVGTVPTAANVKYHARWVLDLAIRRGVLTVNGDLPRYLADARQRFDRMEVPERARIRSLVEILRSCEGEAPMVVAPRLAWRGRVTLLAAREKSGKSTLAQAGAAAVSTGGKFLGESAVEGDVLYLALDESAGDAARRMVRFGVNGERIHLADRVVGSPGDHLRQLVEATGPVLVVVDTLARFAAEAVTDAYRSTEWDRLLGSVCLTARDHDAAIILLGHAKKSDGKYRDSTAIGASVDVILEMDEGSDGQQVRNIEARGRWPVSPFAVRLRGEIDDPEAPLHFDLDSGNLSLDARVLLFVEAHPGCTSRDVRTGVTGRTAEITEAVNRLERRGALEDCGEGMGRALYATAAGRAGTTPEPPREPLDDFEETRTEQGRNHPGTASGTGGGSHPYRGGDGNHSGEPVSDEGQERLEDWI